jgi:hypothetical protein
MGFGRLIRVGRFGLVDSGCLIWVGRSGLVDFGWLIRVGRFWVAQRFSAAIIRAVLNLGFSPEASIFAAPLT